MTFPRRCCVASGWCNVYRDLGSSSQASTPDVVSLSNALTPRWQQRGCSVIDPVLWPLCGGAAGKRDFFFLLWESSYIVPCTVSPRVGYSRIYRLQQHLVSWRIVQGFYFLSCSYCCRNVDYRWMCTWWGALLLVYKILDITKGSSINQTVTDKDVVK